MKQFYPTFLYIKTHNQTGLKYFGKTTNDPYNYRGSGTHWKLHIRKHGYDVSTEIVGYYTVKEECQAAAADFSTKHNIVESKEWANLCSENGLDGGNTNRKHYGPHTEESKAKMSESKKGQPAWNKNKLGSVPGNKHPKSNETREKISAALTGKTQPQETIEKRRATLTGKKRSEESKARMSAAQKNRPPISDETRKKMQARITTEETKQKIREKRKLQVITQETKEKLKGKVVCVNKSGEVRKIDKDLFYSQTEPYNQREWVFHKSKEGMARRK